MEVEKRKHPRFEAVWPIRFNLNPDYHYVPAIRKMGVGGTIRNISLEGLLIDARMDLLDVCQIFSEEKEGDSAFQLEVVLTDSREMRRFLRGVVRWYRVGEPERNIRHFQAGLFLMDPESRAIARNIVESITPTTLNRGPAAPLKTDLN